MSLRKVFLISGNHTQGMHWMDDYDYRGKVTYVTDVGKLYGQHNIQYVLTGAYEDREDWFEIKSVLHMMNAERVG